jgi:hypothetical protein
LIKPVALNLVLRFCVGLSLLLTGLALTHMLAELLGNGNVHFFGSWKRLREVYLLALSHIGS